MCVCVFVGPPYHSQRAMFASPLSAFSFLICVYVSQLISDELNLFYFAEDCYARSELTVQHSSLVTTGKIL